MSRVARVGWAPDRSGFPAGLPTGQQFVAQPLAMWVASASGASAGDADLGDMGPAPAQAHLGEFAVPQRGGMFVIGRAFFSETAT